MHEQYLQRDKSLITLGRNSKIPLEEDWGNNPLDALDVELHDGNLGWALGDGDVVVDVDPRNGGTESYTRLCNDLKLNLRPTVYTAGGGFHIYMRLPEDLIGARFKRKQEQYKGVDFLTKGSFVVIAGSKIGKKSYRFANDSGFEQTEIPLTLANYYQKLTYGSTGDDDDELGELGAFIGQGDLEASQVGQLLQKLDPDMGYEDWCSVGMALHAWHPIEGLPLWDEWSKHGKTYREGECEKKWQSFENTGGITLGTLFHKVKGAEYDKQHQVIEKWIGKIKLASTKEIQIDISPKIRKLEDLDPVSRERIAQAIKNRMKAVDGTSVSITTIREMVTPSNVIRLDDKPEWCENWIYINRFNCFLNLENKQLLKAEAFNLQCGKYVPFGERGTKITATRYVADYGYIKTVSDMLYMPMVDSEFFKFNGNTVYNSFNRNSLPKEADKMNAEGKRAIRIFDRHIKLLCNGNETYARTLKQWIAHQVQYPGVKILWSPVIQSIQGVGKSYLGGILRACLGVENVGVVNNDQVRSQYNSWATGVCVNVLEELRVQGQNRYEIVNSLKPLITDTQIQINPKGVNQYTTINTTNYLCFTNFKDALPLDGDDRRWWIIFTDLENLKQIEERTGVKLEDYYDELYETLNYTDQLRRYFLDYEISEEFKQMKRAPDTEFKQAMIGNESSNIVGYDEVLEVIETNDTEYVTKDIISSTHLFNAIENLMGDVILSPTEKNRIMKKLGFMKHGKRVKLDGKLYQIWSKLPLTDDSIANFRKGAN